jgi:alpha-tubulin suppressor-like RCC1 family protein
MEVKEINSNISLFSWGFGKYGQTGSLEYHYSAEPTLVKLEDSKEPEKISVNSLSQNNLNISQVSLGEFHTAYISNNTLYMFGKNTYGQLGQGHQDILTKPRPVKFPNKFYVEKVACGGEHTLALTNNNELFSWGLNIFGQLGINNTENKIVPTRIDKFRTLMKNDDGNNILKEYARKMNDSESILEISAGAQHSLILTSKNHLYSCGFTRNCSLGYFGGKDDPHESTVFTRIQNKYSANRKFSKITCGVNHSACLLDSYEVLVWGKGDNMSFDTFKRISLEKNRDKELSSIITMPIINDVKIGENFLVILTENGEIFSCGSNEYGQLGLGSQYKYVKSFEKVLLPEKIKSMTLGFGYVYAIGLNKVYGWGNNKYGQLLDIQDKIPTPKEINFFSESFGILSNISQLSCGGYHVIALADYKGYDPKPFRFKTFKLNKGYDPHEFEEEYNALEVMTKKINQLETEINDMEKEIEITDKFVQEKMVQEKKTRLFIDRNKRKSDKSLKITNPLVLFDEEIKYEDLQLFHNSDIGKGTFGEVKRGYWRKTLVAIKFLKKSLENEEENIKSFVEELNLLKRLRHPNILLYIGASTTGPYYFLVTEFCENGNLFDFLHVKKSPLNSSERMRIALEIAKGVNYLHSFNPPILHRDLKSLNILLDKNLKVKIADFGWARLRDIHMTKQRGTFQWMAPEVIKKSSYSEKADVFSFAIILWELWVQEPPYNNIDRIEVAKKVATDKNYRPKKSSEIPVEIKNLMVACWDFDPDKRPDFETVIDYLENLQREKYSF